MNPETLKIVGEIINGLGADARTAFIWYLGTILICNIVNTAAVIGGIYLILRVVRYIVSQVCASSRLYGAAFGCSSPDFWGAGQLDTICDQLRKARDESQT